MNNKSIIISVDSTQEIPNATQSQAGFWGLTETDPKVKKESLNLPVKRTIVAYGGSKLAHNTLQLNLYYNGNKVLQNQVNRAVEGAQSIMQVGAMSLVSPALGIAGVVNEFIDVSHQNAIRTEDIRRYNLDAYEQRDLFNTNLNNGRYSGGAR